jgi:Outer membrane protein beta-barrel domain
MDPALFGGFNIGGSMRLGAKNPLSLSIEPTYLNQLEAYSSSTYGKIRRTHHYALLPILAEWKPKGKFFVELGPELAFWIYTMRFTNSTGGMDRNLEAKTDLGLALGAGYYFSPRFKFNIRATQGFVDQLNTYVVDRDFKPTDHKVSRFNTRGMAGFTYFFGGKE